MHEKVMDVIEGGLNLIRNSEPISLILSIIGLLVALVMFKGFCEDLEKAIEEWLFWRWLKKDGHFLDFTTEKEARDGYIHHLESRKYRCMTRNWRKKYEKKHGSLNTKPEHENSFSITERLSRIKTSLINFWEALDYLTIPDLNDIKSFFISKIRGEKQSENSVRQMIKPKVSLEKRKTGQGD